MDPLTFWFFNLFGGIFAFALGLVAYRSLKYRSFTAGLFDAPIKQTIGAIQPSEFRKQSLTVYAFGQNSAKKSVGLEVIGAIRSYATLSRLEVEKLISLMQLAIQEEAPTERIVGEIPRSESCKHKIVLHVLGRDLADKILGLDFIYSQKQYVSLSGLEAQRLIALLQSGLSADDVPTVVS